MVKLFHRAIMEAQGGAESTKVDRKGFFGERGSYKHLETGDA